MYSGKKSGFYDAATEKAVRKLQAKYGLEVDGIVGGNVLNALSGQIVVDIGDLHLYLYRNGKLIKSYSVATGQAAYPTPTGSFVVTSMQMNPTWLPPNSDWAKDAKPIPPGVDNPLGTRWIGGPGRGHPRHAGRLLHRYLRLARVHPHAHLGSRGALRLRRDRHAGHHPAVAASHTPLRLPLE